MRRLKGLLVALAIGLSSVVGLAVPAEAAHPCRLDEGGCEGHCPFPLVFKKWC